MSSILDIRTFFPTSIKLPLAPWTPETFAAFCAANPDVVCELEPNGNLHIMSPANSGAGKRNAIITAQIVNWTLNNEDFVAFDSSAGFLLPNQAIRSPDASVVARSDWDALSPEQQKSFAPLTPRFLVELRSSETDPLADLQAKMREYQSVGVQLGWLIDPVTEKVHVYRNDGNDCNDGKKPADQPAEILDKPSAISADPTLPGFELDLTRVW